MSNTAVRSTDPLQATVAKLQRKLDRERGRAEVNNRATVAMLASNLAHRLGTPLNVIRGRAELLRREHNPPKAVRGLETIISQIDKITETIKILLELGSYSHTVLEAHDAREVVLSSTDLLQTLAAQHRLTFQLELGGTPIVVRSDPNQLELLFINLIRSVIDAVDERGGVLTVIAQPGDEDYPRTRICFEYSGDAVAPDLNLFDPFSAPREAHDVAMRLAVAQLIARDHDGEIIHESLERGARFLVILPLAPVEAGHQSIR